jgi:hypothetical protein
MSDTTPERAVGSPSDLEGSFAMGPIFHEPLRADRVFDLADGNKFVAVFAVELRSLASSKVDADSSRHD